MVPQLGRDVRDWPPTMELYCWEQVWRCKGLPGSAVIDRLVADIPIQYAALGQRMRAEASRSRSSNKVGGRRKKRKRRKKKLPKLPPLPPPGGSWARGPRTCTRTNSMKRR